MIINAEPQQYRIYVGMPTYDRHPHGHAAGRMLVGATQRHRTATGDSGSSLLGLSFNSLWVEALQAVRDHGMTHFAMLHADCQPDAWWLDTLLEEMDRVNADLVSAVIPIKNLSGLTSTALGSVRNPWAPCRRLTLHEVHDRLPETFCFETCCERIGATSDQCLCVNTGCFVLDLRRPYWTELDGSGALRLYFTVDDRVIPDGDGYKVLVDPEDWHFSRTLHQMGGRIFATRRVSVLHHGVTAFSSAGPFGSQQTDETYVRIKAQGLANDTTA